MSFLQYLPIVGPAANASRINSQRTNIDTEEATQKEAEYEALKTLNLDIAKDKAYKFSRSNEMKKDVIDIMEGLTGDNGFYDLPEESEYARASTLNRIAREQAIPRFWQKKRYNPDWSPDFLRAGINEVLSNERYYTASTGELKEIPETTFGAIDISEIIGRGIDRYYENSVETKKRELLERR